VLSDCVTVPRLPADATSSWAQYTVLLPEGADRAAAQAALRERGIPTAVYYSKPLHRQAAYEQFPAASCRQSERLADRVMSLPMHPYLDEMKQARVIAAVREAVQG
jgi:dTDP-4-amino-4,6-dideoxygalactose transaminase